MEENAKNENEINSKTKSILNHKKSSISKLKKSNKHPNFSINNNNSDNLIFSKFNFDDDYMNKEAKAFYIKMKNLNRINLYEDKVDNSYKWENLFINYKPLKSYVSLKKLNSKKISKTIDENPQFKSPILLVDLPESQMNLFFHKKHYSNDKYKNVNINSNIINNNIRPVSMHLPREEKSSFYYSDAFSDYYKEDFKSFSQKIPLLKAKLKINPEKLKKILYKDENKLDNKLKLLEEKRKDKNIVFNKKELIIAGERKNPKPLVKSVFKEKYASLYDLNEDVKNYEQESKDKVYELESNNKNNKHGYKFKNHLLLSYYDINDPSIALFNNIFSDDNRNKNNKENNFFKENNTSKNLEIYKADDIIFKKDKKLQKVAEKYNKNKTKTQKPKLNIKLSQSSFKKDKKNIKMINIKSRNLTTKNNSNPYNIKQFLNNSNNNINKEYIHPKSFPLKTSSDVGNTSYNRIKKNIKVKQFLNKFKFDYPIPSDLISLKTDETLTDKDYLELILESKKIKPKKNDFLYDLIYEKKNEKKIYQRWDKNGNLINSENNKCNMIYFNKCIRTKYNKYLTEFKKTQDNDCFYPINLYNRGNIEYYKMEKNKNKENNNKSEF